MNSAFLDVGRLLVRAATRSPRRLVPGRRIGLMLSCVAALALLTAAPALALPDGRAYELVSPPDKNGGEVIQVGQLSSDGQGLSWFSRAGYAGTPGIDQNAYYVGRRFASGWSTVGSMPSYAGLPMTLTNNVVSPQWSDDLSVMAFRSQATFDPGDQDFNAAQTFSQFDVYRLTPGNGAAEFLSHGATLPATAQVVAAVVAISGDGSTVFIETTERLTPDVPAAPVVTRLYRWRDGAVAAVGKDAAGTVLASASKLGWGNINFTADLGVVAGAAAISRDGSRFVFSAANPVGNGAAVNVPLWLHVDGQPNVQISSSQRTGSVGQPSPTGATFLYTTGDVSKIFFQSTSQLTDTAPSGGGDYRYDVATGGLTFLFPENSVQSGIAPGGLVAVSSDGARVYFVSPQALAPGATAGQPNLYLHASASTTFVATLGAPDAGDWSGPTASQGATLPRWNPAFTTAGITPDGRFLAFQSVQPLTGQATNGHPQVFRYDAVNGSLACVSCKPGGAPAQGDATIATAWISASAPNIAPAPRAVSDDGTRVFFATTEALVPEDVNGKGDVYEYRDGAGISLISSGTSPSASLFGGISRDGNDAYFLTREALVTQDVDGFYDVYDARVGGGFPADPVPASCMPPLCQGSPGAPPAASIPATTTPSSGVGNTTPSASAPSAPPAEPAPLKVTVSPPGGTRGSTATLRVTVPGSGDVRTSGAGLERTSRPVRSGGTYRLAVALTTRARAKLRREHRLTATVRVVFKPAAGASSVARVRLTFKQLDKNAGR